MDTKLILGLAVAVVMGWFAAGIIYNLRRGDKVLRWMKTGLPKVGERTTFRWLGTSVVEMVLAQPRQPFRRLEILLILVPRDVVFLWLLAHFQGRRDTLILRGQLNHAPPLNLHLVDPSFWTGRTAQAEAAREGWESQPFQNLLLLAPKGHAGLALQTVTQLYPLAQSLSPKIWRLSLRNEQPHFELHLPFPDLSAPAPEFFERSQEFGRQASLRQKT